MTGGDAALQEWRSVIHINFLLLKAENVNDRSNFASSHASCTRNSETTIFESLSRLFGAAALAKS